MTNVRAATRGLLASLVLFASGGVVLACTGLLGNFTEGTQPTDGSVIEPAGDTGTTVANDAGSSQADAATDAPAVDATTDGGKSDGSASAPLCAQTPDDAGTAPVLLASGQSDPEGIVVDAVNVYWVNAGTGTVVSCPLAGCPDAGPTILASGQSSPNRLVVDLTNVYWTNVFTSVQKCPITGCGTSAPTVYAAGSTKAAGLAIDLTTIYWTELQDGVIASCPLAGCTTKNVLYAGPDGPTYGIAVDSANVYWLNVDTGTLEKMPLTGVPEGGAPTVLATTDAGVAFLATDTSNAYFTNEYGMTGQVSRAPLTGEPDGGVPSVVASNQVYLDDIIVDPLCQTLYWSQRGVQVDGGGDPQGTVYRCDTLLCNNNPIPFASNQNGPWGLAQDTTYVYWTDYYGGTVWKKHK